jgi:hypothetical protein
VLSKNRPDKAFSLPSWVPDWSKCPEECANMYDDESHASGQTQVNILFDEQYRKLNLAGVLLDEITYITSDLHASPQSPSQSEKPGIQWLLELFCLPDTFPDYPSGHDRKTAFWRMLIRNKAHLLEKTTPEHEKRYDAWIRRALESSFQHGCVRYDNGRATATVTLGSFFGPNHGTESEDNKYTSVFF